jgi:hypothetical protein
MSEENIANGVIEVISHEGSLLAAKALVWGGGVVSFTSDPVERIIART